MVVHFMSIAHLPNLTEKREQEMSRSLFFYVLLLLLIKKKLIISFLLINVRMAFNNAR